MLVCDRCGNKAKYNSYVGGLKCDICESCNRKLEELQHEFRNIEVSFMRNEFDVIKHIDFERVSR